MHFETDLAKKEPRAEIRNLAPCTPPADRPRKRMRRKAEGQRVEINPYSMYESSARYVLDDLNSIAVCRHEVMQATTGSTICSS